MARRRPSAAKTRQLASQARDRARQDLPQEQQKIVHDYCPEAPGVTWTRVADEVRSLLLRSGGHLTGDESVRKHMTHVAHYAMWLDGAGHPVTFESLTDLALIDEYTRVELATRTENSAADRRSRLRKLAGALNPSTALPVHGHTIPRKAIKPGYTPAETAAIVRVAWVQPTEEKTRAMCAVVGLGLGAGCDSTDLKALLCSDIEDHGDAGMSVTIRSRGGERTVPVKREYEPLVRRALQSRKPNQLVIGQKADRVNVAARIIDEARIYGDVPKIEASRLRSTWLADLLTRPIPLPVILHVAGLKSARTLLDLVPAEETLNTEVAR
ncbi:MAG: hypothetical protein U0S36_04555 [Candidatus Nanopelagicales bacterium]